MTLTAFDTETRLIEPGIAAPSLVCASVYDGFGEPGLIHGSSQELASVFKQALSNGIVGANIVFDLAVMAAYDPTLIDPIFDALEAGRVYSTDILEALHAVAKGHLYKDPQSGRPIGRYSLAGLEATYLGRDRSAQKESGWRFKYALLENVPLDQWPAEAVQYAKDDAKGTWEVVQEQLKEGRENLDCNTHEMRAAWALQLAKVWGIRTDPKFVEHVAGEIERQRAEAMKKFMAEGLIKHDGITDTAAIKARVLTAYGSNPPLTEKGAVKISRDTLLESGDELLQQYAETGENNKLFSTYIETIRAGAVVPLNPSWNVFVASDRTSCASPNLQNLPRGGHIRECYIPRPGWCYLSTDYSGVELCTLAQEQVNLFGHSALADAINAGQDLHLRLAATTLGISYEDALARKKAKDPEILKVRQASKATNFGTPGGMGAVKQVLAARAQGVRFCELLGRSVKCSDNSRLNEYNGRTIAPTCPICLELAERSRKAFFETWPETVQYHVLCGRTADRCEIGEPLVSTTPSKMKRLEPSFCAVANHHFQHRAAYFGKRALWLLAKESYTDRTSVLYNNYRTVAFIHDEVLAEVREEVAHECAVRQAEIMVAAMREGCPDVRISTESALFRRWFKGATAQHDKRGRLRPWWPSDWSWGPDMEQMQRDLTA